VTIVLDTAVVLAAFDARAAMHDEVVAFVAHADEDLVTTPLCVAEMDYMVEAKGGRSAQRVLWDDFASGAYLVRWWADAMVETVVLARRWAHLGIGLADASLIALAARLRTDRIATLDHRHFRHVTTTNGEPFVVLPADAS
jgi:predicted nucleic acid-binding protein